MTQKQKARAYDEAFERARKELQTCGSTDCDAARQIFRFFPELKESEDEQHRKWILEYLYDGLRKADEQFKPQFASAIAWLENQSVQKLTLRERYKNIAKSEWFQKTHEEMSVSEEEPKFQNGEWIVWQNKCYRVNYNGCGYELIDQNGLSTSLEYGTVDENAHLWTIQDAKDGDILSWDDSKCIALFKNIYDEESFNSYGFVGHCTDIFESRLSYHDIEGAHPATKEQRDLLFEKMREADYEWDKEKKELKKIEDEEYNEEDYGIDSLFHAQRILEKTLGKVDGYQTDDGILEHKCAITAIKKLYEQKPTWSEVDENFFANICIIIDADRNFTESAKRRCKDLLKSLKPQKQWKPTKEQMEALLFVVQHYTPDVSDKLAWDSLKILELMYFEIKQ